MLPRLLVAFSMAIVMAACSGSPPPSPPRRAPAAEPAPAEPIGSPTATRLVALARSLLDTPYRASGASPGGFDCSGFTSFLFREAGRSLPRTAGTQASVGRWVAPDELRPGDLVFFGHERNRVHHVGLVVSRPGEPLTMIHASSSRGVVETEVTSSSYWLPRLRFGRRVLGVE